MDFWAGVLCMEPKDVKDEAVSQFRTFLDDRLANYYKLVSPARGGGVDETGELNKGEMKWLHDEVPLDLTEYIRAVATLEHPVVTRTSHHHAKQILEDIAEHCFALNHRYADHIKACSSDVLTNNYTVIMDHLVTSGQYPNFASHYVRLTTVRSAFRKNKVLNVRENGPAEPCKCCGNKIKRGDVKRNKNAQLQDQSYILASPIDGGATVMCKSCVDKKHGYPWRELPVPRKCNTGTQPGENGSSTSQKRKSAASERASKKAARVSGHLGPANGEGSSRMEQYRHENGPMHRGTSANFGSQEISGGSGNGLSQMEQHENGPMNTETIANFGPPETPVGNGERFGFGFSNNLVIVPENPMQAQNAEQYDIGNHASGAFQPQGNLGSESTATNVDARLYLALGDHADFADLQ